MAWAPIAAAAAAAVSPVMDNIAQYKEGQWAASQQQSWEQDMSNSAYQRAQADMKKAGINPILAASQGGASTPSGSMAQIPSGGLGLSQGTNSAIGSLQAGMQMKQAMKSMDVQDSQIAQNTASALESVGRTNMQSLQSNAISAGIANTVADTSNKGQQNTLLQIQQQLDQTRAMLTAANARVIQSSLPALEHQAQAESKLDLGKWDALLSHTLPGLHSAGQAFSNFSPLLLGE